VLPLDSQVALYGPQEGLDRTPDPDYLILVLPSQVAPMMTREDASELLAKIIQNSSVRVGQLDPSSILRVPAFNEPFREPEATFRIDKTGKIFYGGNSGIARAWAKSPAPLGAHRSFHV